MVTVSCFLSVMVTPDLEQAVAVAQSCSEQFCMNISVEGALLQKNTRSVHFSARNEDADL